LVVNDDQVNSAPDAVIITVRENIPPTVAIISPAADNGFPQGATITFTGTGTDAEDGELSGTNLQWSSDKEGVLDTGASISVSNLRVGIHTITLRGTDSQLEVATTSIPIIIVENAQPIANAGADQAVEVGVIVQLDGSGSLDDDGNLLTYQWTAPEGVVLTSETSETPRFEANEPGEYRFTLVANDGAVDSAADEVVITVEPVRVPADLVVDLPGGVTMDLVWIEPGTFLMGSPETEEGRDDDEGPQHEVTISEGFYLGQFEITQGQWEAVMGTQPWEGQNFVQSNPSHPAVYISWEDVQGFVVRLNDVAGEEAYRLPTEAEWEYAARGSSDDRWSFGDDEGRLGEYAWYAANASEVGFVWGQPVATKLPNPWGLYDVHGNVWEWVQDRYSSNYYGLSAPVNPQGPSTGVDRVFRGGDFDNSARFVRSAHRNSTTLSHRSPNGGGRLLRIANRVPEANAGSDRQVELNEAVVLDGSGSSDEDGDGLNYLWTAPEGISLDDATAEQPRFEAGTSGIFEFILVVNDDQVNSAPDAVIITVRENIPPTVAIISPAADSGFLQGATITFTGTGTDTEDGELSDTDLQWSSDKEGVLGTGASISVSNLRVGIHTITLRGTDSQLEVATTSIPIIIVENALPMANAGADQAVEVGVIVQLDGSGSSDDDGNLLTYQWTAPEGVVLINEASETPRFEASAPGEYRFTLVVNDGVVDSAADEVVITVEPVRVPADLVVDLPGGATMDLVWIEPGTFLMGSPDTEEGRFDDEGPQHEVTISQGFYLGQFEITQGQWEAVMGTRPWEGQEDVQSNPSHPAVYISWEDVQGFVVRLNDAASEEIYRLPTEAEWEYAARAGTVTHWSFGDDESQLGEYAWYGDNAWDIGLQWGQPVGRKLPNPWGLYDIHGNVWEWVQDWYGGTYYSESPGIDPQGPLSGSARVVRGGGFRGFAQDVRSAQRNWGEPGFSSGGISVRLLRMAEPVIPNTAPEANAGADQTVGVGAIVQLDGSGSSDTDGDVLNYAWTQIDGPTTTLSSSSAIRPTFDANTAGTYVFELVVDDGTADSVPDEVIITVEEAVRSTGDLLTEDLPGGVTMDFVWIEPGTFTMGSPDTEEGRFDDEGPQHEVTISQGFYLGQFEITQGQWEGVMGTRPWEGEDFVQSNPSHPAVYISWEDMQGFVARLNDAADEEVYRLPTEAEWEYAARAGTVTRWSFGDDESQLGEYAWYRDNAWDIGLQWGQPVGTKLPNPWGLYDMYGNVWEWVQDWYGETYYSESPGIDPQGPSSGSIRVLRGSSFDNFARHVRSADRGLFDPAFRGFFGVRLLRTQ
jgi:formylglycine-generating enzyme required for sulfatase activity